jgi:hypothetical protein
MRTLCRLSLAAVTLWAQAEPSGPALVRGVLLERDPQTASGQFSVRAAPSNQVYRYQFDRKTYVERENQLIDVARLRPGEKVEVVSDVAPDSALRYARTIHVMDDPPPPPRGLTGLTSSTGVRPPRPGSRSSSSADRYLPTGNLTYSGVVFRVNTERLVLRTRQGEQSILLRRDTRFVAEGEIVEAADLKPNMRVFVRAGKDIYDQVEAYQVIWGRILDPK